MLAIGPARSGDNMRIDEFAQPIDDNLPFDVVDDVAVFMRNDPMFYRKVYYPTIMKINDLTNAGKPCDGKKMISKIVNPACNSYCSRYKIPKKGSELLSSDERNSLIEKVYSEEMKEIKNGSYK